MPLSINRNEVAEGASRNLVDAIARHRQQLYRIVLERKSRRGYAETAISLDVMAATQGERDELPEEIAAAIYSEAKEHAAERGATHYRFRLENNSGQELETAGPMLIGDDDDAPTKPANANREAIVDMSELAKKIADDSHRQHMKTMDKTTGLLDKITDLVAKNAEVEISKLRVEHDLESRKIDATEAAIHAEASTRKWESTFGPLTQFGAKFGTAFGSKFADSIGKDLIDMWETLKANMHDEDASLTARVHEFLNQIDAQKIADVSDPIDPDLTELLISLGKSTDDDTTRSLLASLKQRLRSLGTKALPILSELQRQLGEKLDNYKDLLE